MLCASKKEGSSLDQIQNSQRENQEHTSGIKGQHGVERMQMLGGSWDHALS